VTVNLTLALSARENETSKRIALHKHTHCTMLFLMVMLPWSKILTLLSADDNADKGLFKIWQSAGNPAPQIQSESVLPVHTYTHTHIETWRPFSIHTMYIYVCTQVHANVQYILPN
jgi:hypothetical protein